MYPEGIWCSNRKHILLAFTARIKVKILIVKVHLPYRLSLKTQIIKVIVDNIKLMLFLIVKHS